MNRKAITHLLLITALACTTSTMFKLRCTPLQRHWLPCQHRQRLHLLLREGI